VQSAIDSITDAGSSNPYLVWVGPGIYEEQVLMKPHVHLQGSGQGVTAITNDVSTSNWPPDQATLFLASDTSLRDLTVSNTGQGEVNVGVLATPGQARTLVANVGVLSDGGGVGNLGIVLWGSGTSIAFQQVTAVAESGSSFNGGFYLLDSAATVLRGGVFTGQGGQYSRGIVTTGTGTSLEALEVTALGENASDGNVGLRNVEGASATLRGGSFTGRGGAATWGIDNYSDGATATLEAEGIKALAEDGSGVNYGLGSAGYTEVRLYGGSFTARGGGVDGAHAIGNAGGESTLIAVEVTALAENSSTYNNGLHNADAPTELRGGSFTARGGNFSNGIRNEGGTLEAWSATALGENAASDNYGLANEPGAQATIRGGSFIGRGGSDASGILNVEATLDADSVTALGENTTDVSSGLINEDGEVVLRGGSCTGRNGGLQAYGISNIYNDAKLETESTTVLGEGGSEHSYGLSNVGDASATLRGGSFTGRGGTSYVMGIFNDGAVLQADGASALGEESDQLNTGLANWAGAVTVRDGSFTGRGGNYARGIDVVGSGATFEAYGAAALGDNGMDSSVGLYINNTDGWTTIDGGSFSGRGGVHARGLHFGGMANTLAAEAISALAEGGSTDSYGVRVGSTGTMTANSSQFTGGTALYMSLGTVHLGVSQLAGGAYKVAGTMVCYGVYDGSYTAYTCP
jgi:hypothetical protein